MSLIIKLKALYKCLLVILTANDVLLYCLLIFQIMFTKNLNSICHAIALPRWPAISLNFKDVVIVKPVYNPTTTKGQ